MVRILKILSFLLFVILFANNKIYSQTVNYTQGTISLDVTKSNPCDLASNGFITFDLISADGGNADLFIFGPIGDPGFPITVGIPHDFDLDNGGFGLPIGEYNFVISDGTTSFTTFDPSPSLSPIILENEDSPLQFNITNPSTYLVCSGENAIIGLDGSETGIEYTPYVNGTPIPSSTLTGDGNPLSLTVNSTDFSNADQITVFAERPFSTCPPVQMLVGGATNPITVQLIAPTIIDDQPDDVTICEGEDTSFTIATTPPFPSVSYQWQVDEGSGYNDIPGETNPVLTLTSVPASDNGNRYQVVVSSATCPNITTTTALLTVNSPPTNLDFTGASPICEGDPAVLDLTVTGGVGPYIIELSQDGGSTVSETVNVPNNATFPYTTAPLTTTTTFTVVSVTDVNTCTLVSLPADVTIVVNPAPDPGLTVSDVVMCNPAESDVIITITGAEVGVTYELTDGGTPLSPAVTGVGTGADLDLTILQGNAPLASINYTVVATIPSCPPVNLTDLAEITVNNQPNAGLAVSDPTICNPATGDVTITVTGAESGVTYEVTDGGTPLSPPVTGLGSGADLDLIIPQAQSPAADISYTIVASIAGCSPVSLTDPADVIVNDGPDPGLTVSDVVMCNPAESDVIITITGAEEGVTYELTDGGTPLSPAVTGVGTGADLDLTILQGNAPLASINYTVVATIPSCPPVNLTDLAEITVNNQPNAGLAVSDPTICNPATGDVTITVTGAESGVTYEVTDGGTPLSPPVTGLGSGADLDLIIPQAQSPAADISYTIVASIAGCSPVSLTDPADVIVNDGPDPGLTVSDVVMCNPAESDVIITITGAEVGVTYELTDGGTPLSPAVTGVGTGADLDLTILQANAPLASINYTVVATIPSCPPVNLTDLAEITVNNQPNAGLAVSDPTICNPATGDVTITVTGAESGVTFEVTDGGTPLSPPVTGLGSGADLDLIIPQAQSPAADISYTIVASISGCSLVSLTDLADVTVNPGIVITTQPVPETVCEGTNVTFTVAATGVGLTYQWQVDDGTGGGFADIPGEVADNLDLGAVAFVLNGNQYRVIVDDVSATCPAVTSDEVLLTVDETPVISDDPDDTTVCEGEDVTFTAAATGTGISLQWQESTDGGANFNDIAGENGNTLTLTGLTVASNGFQYQVVASAANCPDAISIPATLTVNPGIVITTQPVPETVCEGTNVTFTVAATGVGLTYQWQVDDGTGGGFTDIPGEVADNLDLGAVAFALNGNQYRVIVDDVSATCPAVISDEVLLTVDETPMITDDPDDTTVCEGEDVTFTAAATGTGISLQWQESTDGGANFNDIAGENGNTLTLTGLTVASNGFQYQVVASAANCPDAISIPATLTVNPGIVITTQPVPETVCEGTNVTFTVAATGVGLTYQWQVDDGTGGGFTDIPGEVADNLDLGAVAFALNGNQYRVIVDDVSATCPGVISDEVLLTVDETPVITDDPDDTTVCEGEDVTFTAAATGTGISLQWQESIDGGANFNDIVGENSVALTLTSLTVASDGFQYRVVVTGPNCPDATSLPATLTVNPGIVITDQPDPAQICEGDNVTFTVAATNATSFQWQVDDGSGGGFVDIAGEVGTDLTLTAVPASASGNQYRVIVDDASATCPAIISDEVALTVNALPTVSLISTDFAVCDGTDATFDIALTGTGGGTWDVEYTINGALPAIQVNGLTNTTETITILSTDLTIGANTIVFTAVQETSGITCIGAPVVGSETIVITKDQPPTALTMMEAGFPLCAGSTTLLTFQITDGTAPFEVDLSTDGGTTVSETVSIPDNNSFDYTTSPLSITTTFTVVEVRDANGCNLDPGSFPADVVVDIVPLPTVITPPDFSACFTDGAFDIVGTFGGSATSASWTASANASGSFVESTVGSDVTLTYTPDAADVGETIIFTITTDDPNGCGPATQTVNVLIVSGSPTTTPVISGPAAGCNNETAVTFTSTTDPEFFEYVWVLNGGTPIVTVTNTIDLDLTGLTVGTQALTVTGRNGCGDGPTSAIFNFEVNDAPVIDTDPVDQTGCAGEDVSFVVAATGSNLAFQWQVDDGSGFADIAGETNATLTLAGVQLAQNSFQYRANVSNGACPIVSSAAAILTVNDSVSVTTQPVSQTVEFGFDATFTVEATGSNVTYQWQVSIDGGTNFTDLSGQTAETLTLTAVNDTFDGNQYRAVISSDCGDVNSDVATLTVIDNRPPDCSNFIVQVASSTNSNCNADNGSFVLNTNGTGVIPYTVEVYIDDGSTTPILIQSDTIVVSLAPNTYRYILSDSNGCSFEEGGVVIEENQIVATFSETTDGACSGTDGAIVITIEQGGGNYEYSLDQQTWTPFASGETLRIPPGDYSAIFVRDPSGDFCPTNSGPISISEPTPIVYRIETITESAPERASGSILIQPIGGGTPIPDIGYEGRLRLVTPTAPDQFQPQFLEQDWTQGTFISELGIYQFEFQDLFAGFYEIELRDSNQCTIMVFADIDSQTMVEIPVDTDLFIPNVFTPNQDGFNDFFFIRNMPEDQATTVSIVNRWGSRVYQSDDYQNDWKAEDVSDGVYYYTISVGGETFTGWVEVWRGSR